MLNYTHRKAPQQRALPDFNSSHLLMKAYTAAQKAHRLPAARLLCLWQTGGRLAFPLLGRAPPGQSRTAHREKPRAHRRQRHVPGLFSGYAYGTYGKGLFFRVAEAGARTAGAASAAAASAALAVDAVVNASANDKGHGSKYNKRNNYGRHRLAPFRGAALRNRLARGRRVVGFTERAEGSAGSLHAGSLEGLLLPAPRWCRCRRGPRQ